MLNSSACPWNIRWYGHWTPNWRLALVPLNTQMPQLPISIHFQSTSSPVCPIVHELKFKKWRAFSNKSPRVNKNQVLIGISLEPREMSAARSCSVTVRFPYGCSKSEIPVCLSLLLHSFPIFHLYLDFLETFRSSFTRNHLVRVSIMSRRPFLSVTVDLLIFSTFFHGTVSGTSSYCKCVGYILPLLSKNK